MCQGPGARRSDRATAWDGSEGRREAVPRGSVGPGPQQEEALFGLGERSGLTQGPGLSHLEDR